MKKCPICGNDMKAVETLYGKLNTANVVSNSDAKVKRVDLTVYKCPVCDHGAIDNYLDDEFYVDFAVALGADANNEAAINQRSKQFEPIIDYIAKKAPNTNSLLEIGSGCGYLLNAAKKKFSKVIGVEPSRTEYDISVKVASGCEIINDYFYSGLNLNGNISAFTATMVFEHIPDILSVMKYAYTLLVDNGIGFITVPNGQRSFRGGCYFDIYPQHFHYYSINSLYRLAVESGFEVVFVRESENNDYLEMLVRKSESKYLDRFNQRLDYDRQKLQEYASRFNKVSIWGASYLARSCVEFFDSSRITHFYDVSGIKIGQYIAGFSKQIEYPTKDSVIDNDLIIIMANEYTKDILNTLKQYEYRGAVIGFDNDGYLSKYEIR